MHLVKKQLPWSREDEKIVAYILGPEPAFATFCDV